MPFPFRGAVKLVTHIGVDVVGRMIRGSWRWCVGEVVREEVMCVDGNACGWGARVGVDFGNDVEGGNACGDVW